MVPGSNPCLTAGRLVGTRIELNDFFQKKRGSTERRTPPNAEAGN